MVTVLDTLKARPRHPEKAHRPDTPILRKPDWIRVRAPGSPVYNETRAIVRENRLVTVCEEAGCPNIGECWSKKHATFMIMGDTCTRACAFCNVKTGLPGPLDSGEPVAQRYFLFELGSELDQSAIDLALRHNVTPTAAINTFRYTMAKRDEWEGPKEDIARLRSLGLRHYQVDSRYESLFS